MVKFKKEFNFKIAVVLINIALLWNSALYAGDALRVPMGVRDRAEVMQGKLSAEEKDLINRLSGDDTKIIDAALLELDRIPDAERVKNIIEQVFKNRGLILKRSNYYEGKEDNGVIQILSIDNSDAIGKRPYRINREEHTIIFNFASLNLSKLSPYKFPRHRLLPMLHRWMTTQNFFKQFSGYGIEVVISNFQGAMAWWRSGLPIKIRSLRGNRVINDINEIDKNNLGERYKITGTFLSWEDSFKYGFRTTEGIKHMPRGKWAYLAHTGAIDLHPHLLEALYKNLENSRREIFCCLKITPDKPIMLGGPAGLILNIQDDGEVLYAGNIRSAGNEIFPLEKEDKELSTIKDRMRTRREIDFTSPKDKDQLKEIDITAAKIEGVSINPRKLRLFW